MKRRGVFFVVNVCILMSFCCSASGQYLPLIKGGDLISRYGLPIHATPAEPITLVSDMSQLEVILSKDTNTLQDVTNTSGLISFFTPAVSGVVSNEIISITWKGKVSSDVMQGGKLDKILFRNNGRGQFSLAVVSKKDASIFITRRLISVVPALFDRLFDQQTGIVDLDKLTPDLIRSQPWPFRSSTEVTIEEDYCGFLLMTGTVEFLVMPAMDNFSGSLKIGQLVVEAGSRPMVNFGDGTRIVIKTKLNAPVELFDDDGAKHTVFSGSRQRAGGKWVE